MKVAARRDRRRHHLVVGGFRLAVADIVHDRAVEQRDILRHHADGFAQAVLRDAGDVLAVEQDAAALRIVEALQKREHGRFAAAGMADQADALARPEVQVEIGENPLAVAVAEVDVFEFDAGAAIDQGLGGRMIAQLVRYQERGERFGQPCDMLGDVDQRHREIARRMQHRKTERTGEHDIAGGGVALPP